MSLKRLNNTHAWLPSETELRVAELLASGYSQNRAAVLCYVDQSTISRWYARPEFEALVAELTARFLNSGDAVHAQTVALARLLIHQAMIGDLAADDPTVELAERVLAQTDWFQRRGEKRQQFGRTADPDQSRLP